MDAPPVQYVKTSDGYSIAYGVSGSGRSVVMLPWAFDHVQLAWRYPGLAPWLERMVASYQLIQIDLRGSGMSTRGLTAGHSFGDYQLDLDAVFQRLDIRDAICIGATTGAHVLASYAVNHAERVAALVMMAPTMITSRHVAGALFEALSEHDWDFFLHSLVPHDRGSEERRLTVELLKDAYGQHDFVERMRARDHFIKSGGVENLSSRLETPTLILAPKDYVIGDVNNSMTLARLYGAQIALVDGATAYGDVDQGFRAMENFLAALRVTSAAQAGVTEALSGRELEVLRLIAAGRSNAQIAETLVISPNTVGRHVSNIFDKIGAANRAEAATYALRHGIA